MDGGDSNQQQQDQQRQQMQQQQWLAMQQYQQQWMAMQQYMMYNQRYMPYYHPQFIDQQQQLLQSQPPQQIHPAGEDNKTIWIGDLHPWMDENYLHSCFSHTGEVASVKIIRNKQTGESERYGFVEFNSHAAAEKVLQSYNGSAMPNADQLFRLNWASFSSTDRRSDGGSELSVFVGDLASDVTDELLHETFASNYPSVKGAKVVVDGSSGRSKGYGFVRFADESERDRAMTEMNGVNCSGRPMRVSVATPKKSSSSHQQYYSQAVTLSGGYANGLMPQGQPETDPSNTTIFVGGLDSEATDEELRRPFSDFGEILSVKIPAGKGCGFVQFENRSNAEEALERLNGVVIGKQAVRLSWGKNMGNKQSRGNGNGQWNGAYYGRQANHNQQMFS